MDSVSNWISSRGPPRLHLRRVAPMNSSGQRERGDDLSQARKHIIYLVGIVWSISVISDIALGEAYSPSPLIHTALTMVLGGLFGKELLTRNGR